MYGMKLPSGSWMHGTGPGTPGPVTGGGGSPRRAAVRGEAGTQIAVGICPFGSGFGGRRPRRMSASASPSGGGDDGGESGPARRAVVGGPAVRRRDGPATPAAAATAARLSRASFIAARLSAFDAFLDSGLRCTR
jgi:hypothetical protein